MKVNTNDIVDADVYIIHYGMGDVSGFETCFGKLQLNAKLSQFKDVHRICIYTKQSEHRVSTELILRVIKE